MKGKLKTVLEYAGAVLLCLLLLTCVMKLWRADLKTPFAYFGDALLYSVATKGAIEHGWWLHNPNLGAPNGLKYGAYPAIENFHFLLIKLISWFTGDHASTLNLFYLLTFPLTAITSLYVLRYLRFSYPVALLASLLYTFLPYHFFRSYHLFLAAYYLLPLMILVVLWVSSGERFLLVQRENSRWPKLDLKSGKSIFSLAVCAMVGSCGIYYPFFSCFLLLIAGVRAVISRRSIYALMPPVILIGFMSVVLLINYVPLIQYQRAHGTSSMGARSVVDAEIMGLKITQLLLPIGGHRLPSPGELKYRYNLGPLVNENDTASLGLVGSIGFMILLFALFYRTKDFPILSDLSILNVSAVLLATIGGFGVLFALLVSPQIRAYNRISVFIAFFCLVAVALILDVYYRRLKTRKTQLGFILVLGVVLVAGIYDQTSTTFFFVPEYDKIKNEYQSDREFVSSIEASLPAGAMIFQLPYMPFPESPPLHKMFDHDLFKAYLHSKSLRWSYGAINGETEDLWQRSVAAKPVAEFVEGISSAGFRGIYLNRDGYADGGAQLEGELTSFLGTPPLVSRKGNLSFFKLGD